jgi:hypothetical protein
MATYALMLPPMSRLMKETVRSLVHFLKRNAKFIAAGIPQGPPLDLPLVRFAWGEGFCPPWQGGRRGL